MPDDLRLQPIERRHTVRGFFAQLQVSMDQTYSAEEVSRQAIFVRTDPDRFELGQRFDAVMHVRGQRVACQLEVTRKQRAPRPGVALLIVDIAADQAYALEAAIDAAQV
jgi:hypothetical protein